VNDFAAAKTVNVTAQNNAAVDTNSHKTISIRVSPNGYFAALLLSAFFSAFLIYLEIDWAGILLFAAGWTLFPALLWTDRIVFDGKRLTRAGLLPRIWAWSNNFRYRLKLSDIEQVETQSLRALKRGGNVFYRYRTSIQGKNLKFAFASGGEHYRQMIHQIFPLLPENALDNRSIELRDYLLDPKEILMKAEFAKIPSAEVLESSLNNAKAAGKNRGAKFKNKEIGSEELEKADYLHRLANELRLSGYLLQSLEAFRRALVLTPKNAWLIFDFARCLHSFAGAEHDDKLERRAFAALRIAEKHGAADGNFLARLGECYFQFGERKRARQVFQKAADAEEESFRSVRGLAEIALRDGKIAHVIHNFATAHRLAETAALRRWTQSESDYFSRLNADEDYMELEISRVNLLENLDGFKKSALRVALFGFPAISFGLIAEDNLIANLGWAISAAAILVWAGLFATQNLLSTRVPMDIEEED
jgi:tetratricopeptide (TPR) repeat protein